jgi:hypothetical protein
MTYQWRKNGNNIQSATQNTYTISPVQAGDAGVYSVQVINGGGSVNSRNATLTILVAPSITTQPQSQAVAHNANASFSVVASGSTPLSYHWSLNGAPVPGPGSTLALNKVKWNDAGNYMVVVANSLGSVTSVVATLTVDAPPFITTQPQNQTAVAGQNASFSVTAIGLGTLSYEWGFNGTTLTGATNSVLTSTNVQPTNAGSYTVVVANYNGSVTSVVATLTVNVPAGIATQPLSQMVVAGQNATFNVAASGTALLSYQWSWNGTTLSGATNSVLTLTNVQTTNAGSYMVVVTNAQGSVTSAVATLTVTPPVLILSLSGVGGMTSNGFTFQLSVPVGCTYIILASTNLQDWTPIYTNVAASGSVVLTDTAATNYNNRFYKALVP